MWEEEAEKIAAAMGASKPLAHCRLLALELTLVVEAGLLLEQTW